MLGVRVFPGALLRGLIEKVTETIPSFVRVDLGALDVALPDAAIDALGRYLDLLLAANRRVNLTGIRDRDEAWRRHIIDSLTLLPGLADLPDGSIVIDVGSGGGLPGVPVAIALPHVRVTLLEATGKKANFLGECVEQLGLQNVQVVQDRAETVGQSRTHRQHYDAAICRAIGPMRELLEYTLPLVAVGGRVLAMKGPKAEAELRQASDALSKLGAGELQVFDAYPEGFDRHTVVVCIAKASPTPKGYPRRPGLPRQDPL